MLSRPRSRGMSIIEVMVTVSIVGLLMALAAPAAGVWIQNTQLRNAAESVLNGIQLARLEALKRNTTIGFELSDPNTTAWRVCIWDLVSNACSTTVANLHIKSASEGSPNARVGIETVLSTVVSPLDPGEGLPATITFDAFGRFAPSAPANIVRVDARNPVMDPADERRLVILVNVGGQVRMCDPKLSKAVNPQGCI